MDIVQIVGDLFMNSLFSKIKCELVLLSFYLRCLRKGWREKQKRKCFAREYINTDNPDKRKMLLRQELSRVDSEFH